MLSFIFLELTLREVLADIPHDGGAIIVFALVIALIAFVWHGSRNGQSSTAQPTRSQADESATPADQADPRPAAGPESQAVLIDPTSLSAGSDVRRMHPEVR